MRVLMPLVALVASGCALVPCSIAGERACKANHSCHAVYSPSTCGPGPNPICTADLVYRGCSAIPDDELKAQRAALEQCAEVKGAKWSGGDDPRHGICACVDARPPRARLVEGELRYVVRAANAGIRSNDGRVLDEGVVVSPSGRPECLAERTICELNHGTWKAPEPTKVERTPAQSGCYSSYVYEVATSDGATCTRETFDAAVMGMPPCEGVTLLREGSATIVVDTRSR